MSEHATLATLRDPDDRFPMSGPTIPADACTWCGHERHADACTRQILARTARKDPSDTTRPCPCARRADV